MFCTLQQLQKICCHLSILQISELRPNNFSHFHLHMSEMLAQLDVLKCCSAVTLSTLRRTIIGFMLADMHPLKCVQVNLGLACDISFSMLWKKKKIKCSPHNL